jgi:hypothetical protein
MYELSSKFLKNYVSNTQTGYEMYLKWKKKKGFTICVFAEYVKENKKSLTEFIFNDIKRNPKKYTDKFYKKLEREKQCTN